MYGADFNSLIKLNLGLKSKSLLRYNFFIFGAENPDLIGDEGEENEALKMKPRVLTLGDSLSNLFVNQGGYF